MVNPNINVNDKGAADCEDLGSSNVLIPFVVFNTV